MRIIQLLRCLPVLSLGAITACSQSTANPMTDASMSGDQANTDVRTSPNDHVSPPLDSAVTDSTAHPDSGNTMLDAQSHHDDVLIDVGTILVDQVAQTPPSNWVNVTRNLAGMSSECGNVSMLVSHPSTDMLITDVAQHGLWASTDGAASWHSLGTGSGSATITNRTSAIVFDPANPMVFWESGIYNGGGVYRSNDNGNVLTQLGDAHHNDSVAIDFTDPQRLTLLAGGHEQAQTLNRSTDGGQTWTNVGTNLPANTNFCTQSIVVDHQTYLVGCSGYLQGATDGIFRSTDSGASWHQVSTVSANNQPLWAANGAMYWPVIYNRGLVRSTDLGDTWTQVVDYGVIVSIHPIELPDHRLASIGSHHIVLSSDSGATWTPIGDALPYDGDPTGIAYSPYRRAFYVYHFDCMNNVPADAILQFGFDYTSH